MVSPYSCRPSGVDWVYCIVFEWLPPLFHLVRRRLLISSYSYLIQILSQRDDKELTKIWNDRNLTVCIHSSPLPGKHWLIFSWLSSEMQLADTCVYKCASVTGSIITVTYVCKKEPDQYLALIQDVTLCIIVLHGISCNTSSITFQPLLIKWVTRQMTLIK